MLGTPHFRGKRLADLCHRLAISDESGIDVRRTWNREAEHARGGVRTTLAIVRDAVAGGETLTDALRATGTFFPRLFLEMAEVGEQSGRLSVVYHRLSNHYQRGHERAHQLRAKLAWPALQLTAAVTIVGLMLYLFAVLGVKDFSGKPVDLLGLGPGMTGVMNYISLLVFALLAISFVIVSIRREMAWTRPIESLLIRLPSIGPCIEKLCLARLTWALHLTLNVEMDLRKLIPLVLRSAGNDHYTRYAQPMADSLERGATLTEAFATTGAFPPHFLDALHVAEESGQLVESMGRLSAQYDDEAEAAMDTLSTIFSFLLMVGVATLIILMIFKLASFYIGVLNDAAGL